MVRKWKQMHTADRMKHLLLYMIGVGIMPLGVVLTIHAHLGSGGYDALNFALADRLGINTSFAIYGTALVVLLFTALIRGSIPHFATFISSFLLGLFTDLWKWILRDVEGTSILTSILLMVTGLLVIGFAVACYVISIFPTNPTDDFVVALHEKGWNLGVAKIMLDVVCVVLAFLLGGEIGVGTIICTFGLGPVIDLFHKVVLKVLHLPDAV